MEEKLKEILSSLGDKLEDVNLKDIAKLLKRLEAIAAIIVRVTPTDNDDMVFNTIVKPIVDEIIAALEG